MKKPIALIFSCFLTMFSTGINAGEREDALKLVDSALVLVRQVCVYTTILKKGTEVKLIISETVAGMGTGYFVDRLQKAPNYYNIFTAGHVVDCDILWYAERLKDRIPYGIDALELIGNSLRTDIKHEGIWYQATVEDSRFGGLYPDYARLLTAVLPDSKTPHLVPYGLKRGEYDVGSSVVFRGFMSIGENSEFSGADHGMMLMLDEALIQFMGKNFFRISLAGYSGMSGSPILFWKNGKYYAIGIVSAAYHMAPGAALRSAIVTDLDFLNK